MVKRPSVDVRSVSTGIARELLARVEPRLLDQFDLAEEAAFGPSLAGVLLGDETLAAVAGVLRALADAIDDQGGSVYKTSSSQEDAATMMLNAVLSQLKEQRHETQGSLFVETLREVFREKFIDVLPVITPSVSVEEEQREILRRCVLKISDGKNVSTGFALCDQRHILTPAHVALRYRKVDVSFGYGGNPRPEVKGRAEVIHLDERPDRKRDIAILLVGEGDWQRFREAGLKPAPLALDWRPRDPVLCLGYQEQHITNRPRFVGAAIDPWDPILPIRFGAEQECQDCLIFTWPPGEGQITFGMSGGPVLNLHTNRVIAMVTGAELPAWQRQDDDIWIQVSRGHGFAVPLSDVAKSWSEFERCCLGGSE